MIVPQGTNNKIYCFPFEENKPPNKFVLYLIEEDRNSVDPPL